MWIKIKLVAIFSTGLILCGMKWGARLQAHVATFWEDQSRSQSAPPHCFATEQYSETQEETNS